MIPSAKSQPIGYAACSRVNGQQRACDIVAAVLVVALGITGLSGCSSSAAPDATAAQKTTLMNFDLSQCQPIDTGLYKCPAVDKPVCNPDLARSDVECVRVGRDGSVYVLR